MANEHEVEAAFRSGQQPDAVFSDVVHLYHERLYWVIRKMVLNHEDAHDLTQEVFIKAWEKRAQFKGDAKLFTWLYRIAVNAALEHLRKAKKRYFFSIDGEAPQAVLQLQSDPYFSGDEADRKFQEALLKLPEKQRLVFQMKYFEEMKYQDMSAVLDTSVGALKASYHHATQKLKQLLHLD